MNLQIQQYSLVHLKEEEIIPLERAVNDKESKQQLFFPFSKESTQLVNYISDRNKKQLQEEINKRLACFDILDNPQLQNTKKLDQTMDFKFMGLKNDKIEYLEDYLPEFIYGGNSLQKNKTDYNFKRYVDNELQQNRSLHIKNIQYNIQIQNNQHNFSILIYQGESSDNLRESINNLKQCSIVPIILITCRGHFKYLFEEYNEEIYQKIYMPLQNNYSSSQNHAFLIEVKTTQEEQEIPAFFFIFFQDLDRIQMIRWIYLGILNFVDPNFVVISASNLKFEMKFSKLFAHFEKNKNIFGIQWVDRKTIEGSYWKLLNQYIQIPQTILTTHSIFKQKQFHDPLQCIYKWRTIENYIPQFYNQLLNTMSTNQGGYGLNSVLPDIMMQDQLELFYLNDKISSTITTKKSETDLVEYFIVTRQNIYNQIGSQEKTSINQKINLNRLFQSLFCQFQLIQSYLGISICFFFSFHSSYQFVNHITKESVGYTAIAIIVPIAYALNVFLFTLISNIYHSQDRIMDKTKLNTITYQLQFTNSDKIDVKSRSQDTQYLKLQESISRDDSRINFNLEVQMDNFILDLSQKLPENLNQDIIFQANIPRYQRMTEIFQIFLSIQKLLDFAVFLYTFINLLILYGEHLLDQSIFYQSIIIFFAIFIIISELFQKGINILAYSFNFSLLTYFWQIQNIQYKKCSPQIQLTAKRQLAEKLLINGLIFYCFIAIESYFNYQGYILVGILGYLSFVSLISGLIQLVVHSKKQVKFSGDELAEYVQHIDGNNNQCPLSLREEKCDELLNKARFLVQLAKIDKENKEKQRDQQQQQQSNQQYKSNNNDYLLNSNINLQSRQPSNLGQIPQQSQFGSENNKDK